MLYHLICTWILVLYKFNPFFKKKTGEYFIWQKINQYASLVIFFSNDARELHAISSRKRYRRTKLELPTWAEPTHTPRNSILVLPWLYPLRRASHMLLKKGFCVVLVAWINLLFVYPSWKHIITNGGYNLWQTWAYWVGIFSKQFIF